MHLGSMSERFFNEHRLHPEFTACSLSVNLYFEAVAPPEAFEQHRKLDSLREREHERLVGEVLERRKKSEVAAMEMIGMAMLSSEERAEIAQRLDAFDLTLDDPVQVFLTNLRKEAEAGLRPIIDGLLKEGLEVERGFDSLFGSGLKVEARIPLFGSLDDFGAALERGFGRFGRLRQAVKRAFGLTPPPAPRPVPYVSLSYANQFHGPKPLIAAAVAHIEGVIRDIGTPQVFTVDYHGSVFRPTEPTEGLSVEENARLAAEIQESEERASRPLPEPGRLLFAILKDVGASLKASDPQAFEHADRFVALVRDNPDVLRLFRQPPGRPWRANETFKAASDRKLRKLIEGRFADHRKAGDLDGLCDFFFEIHSGREGAFRELYERIEDVSYPRCDHEFYDAAFARVFGPPEAARRHWDAFMKEGHGAEPKRLRELNARHNAELEAWGKRIDTLRALEGEADSRAAEEDAPDDRSAGPTPHRSSARGV